MSVKSLRLLFLAVLVLTTFSCGKKKGTETAGSTEPVPVVPPDVPPVSVTSPLAIKIYTVWDGGGPGVTTHKFVETDTDTCEASAANPDVTCTVVIPEAVLYYSTFNIIFSYMQTNDACKIAFFDPYYYRASTTGVAAATGDGFFPYWNQFEEVNCAESPVSADCFNGAAKEMVSGFPKSTGIVLLPDITNLGPQSVEFSAGSAFKKAGGFKFGPNRWISNDLPAAKHGNAYDGTDFGYSTALAGDGLIAGSFQDYTFSCSDDWSDPTLTPATPYKITLIVKDEDTKTGNSPIINHHSTWTDLP